MGAIGMVLFLVSIIVDGAGKKFDGYDDHWFSFLVAGAGVLGFGLLVASLATIAWRVLP